MPLRERVALLEKVTFQKDLGSYAAKTERVRAVAKALAAKAAGRGLAVDAMVVDEAAALAKTEDVYKRQAFVVDGGAVEGDVEGDLVVGDLAGGDGDRVALLAGDGAGELVAVLSEGEGEREAVAAVRGFHVAGPGAGDAGGECGDGAEAKEQGGAEGEELFHRMDLMDGFSSGANDGTRGGRIATR